MEVAPNDPPRPDPPAPVGELIVQSGRLNGARKPLDPALTLFGSAEGCDVRLNAEGILPVHCALVCGAAGFVVRALSGAATLLNGRPVSESPIRDGDLLAVGAFQFRVVLTAACTDLEREKDALRIQAAAVAAQQAALTDEEVRLQQRRVALERQEGQLSTHLEDRRQQLMELQDQVRAARMALHNERTEHEQRVAETTDKLVQARGEVKAGEVNLRDERRQLSELHARLKRRHADHWKAAGADLRRREERLEEERHKLEVERAALNDARLRFNGEVELSRRQLQDGWDEFRLARERRGCEDAERGRRYRELTRSERALEDQWQHWHETRQGLEAEAEGLESRVRNLRLKLQEQEAHDHDSVHTSVSTPTAPAPPSQPELGAAERDQVAVLETLAASLADQRLHLLEQAERLVRAERELRALLTGALGEVEEAARRLQGREDRLGPRDRALADAEAELLRRAESAAGLQFHLDGWQARLTARAAAWDADRDTLLASVREREEVTRRQAELLSELRQRWAQRRRREVAAVRGELQRCQATRRQYAALWEECHNNGAALERQQRAVAEQALALEQLRLEVIGRAPDSAAAEKRLERLRRRCAAPTAAARRNLDRERQALDAERTRLQEKAAQLDRQAATLAEREADLTRRLAEWEAGKVGAETAHARLRAEVASLTARRAYREREAQALRDEVERLARLMMDDGPTLLTLTHAA
jgi:chromosome segregation ATPase